MLPSSMGSERAGHHLDIEQQQEKDGHRDVQGEGWPADRRRAPVGEGRLAPWGRGLAPMGEGGWHHGGGGRHLRDRGVSFLSQELLAPPCPSG